MKGLLPHWLRHYSFSRTSRCTPPRLFHALADHFIHDCVMCRCLCTSREDLCPDCQHSLPWILSACRGCGLPLPESAQQLLCGECLQSGSPFKRVCIPFLYQEPINQWITGFKHQHQLQHGAVLGRLLTREIQERYLDEPLPQIILPVPLHWRRLMGRGFNQSLEIGRQLQEALHIPLHARNLQRKRPTPSQQGLDRQQRLGNLKGAFVLRRPLETQSVALLDDVVTTGATAHSIARLLLQQGAREVHLWALARTPRYC